MHECCFGLNQVRSIDENRLVELDTPSTWTRETCERVRDEYTTLAGNTGKVPLGVWRKDPRCPPPQNAAKEKSNIAQNSAPSKPIAHPKGAESLTVALMQMWHH